MTEPASVLAAKEKQNKTKKQTKVVAVECNRMFGFVLCRLHRPTTTTTTTNRQYQ